MPITVAMIEEKEFKTKIRGYDPEEVDAFLDDICDEMVAMQDEIQTLQARLTKQQSSAGTVPAPISTVPAPASFAPAQTIRTTPIPAAPIVPAPEAPRVVERTVIHTEEDSSESAESAQKLLMKAQKMYDDMIADAKQEADDIVSNARLHANSGLADLKSEEEHLKDEIVMLKSAAKDYRARFRRLVEDQQHVLNAENELFKDDSPADEEK